MKRNEYKIKAKVKLLDLGCGTNKKEGHFGIDISPVKGVDLVYDLSNGIPFPNNSIDKIFTKHFLEHIDNLLYLIEEMFRVLKLGGIAEIIVPHWSWYGSYTFMHKRFFHSFDFYFLEPGNLSNYYTKAKFRVLSVKLNWGRFLNQPTIFGYPIFRWMNKIANFILNINLKISEEFFVKIFSPKEIRVILKKV